MKHRYLHDNESNGFGENVVFSPLVALTEQIAETIAQGRTRTKMGFYVVSNSTF